jgi:hypothetical protein
VVLAQCLNIVHNEVCLPRENADKEKEESSAGPVSQYCPSVMKWSTQGISLIKEKAQRDNPDITHDRWLARILVLAHSLNIVHQS